MSTHPVAAEYALPRRSVPPSSHHQAVISAAAAPTGDPVAPVGVTGRKAILAGSLGNLVEWYDWAVYGYFAAFFSGQFFPSGSATTSLLLSLSVFAVGFFMRPLGGLVLGAYGDRRGRRAALLLTVGLMSLGSLGLTVLPGYGVLGVAAPVLLLVIRLVQGFSAGGEFGSSSAFLVEHAAHGRRGLVGSFQQVTVTLGLLLGSAFAVGLTHALSHEQLTGWAWRLPFGFGSLLAFYTLWRCWRTSETPSFERLQRTDRKVRRPSLAIFTRYPRACLRVFAFNALGGVAVYLWTLYMPTYAHSAVGLSAGAGQLANSIGLVVLAVCIPLAGALSDRVGRRPVLLGYAAGFALLAYPLLHFVLSDSFVSALVVEVVGAVLLSGWMGCLPAVAAEQFPAEVRATGIAFPYAVAIAVFGGTAPLLATWLLHRHAQTVLEVYIVVLAVISVAVFALIRETKDVELS